MGGEKIFEFNIGDARYRVKVREKGVSERPYVILTVYFNAEKDRDRELLKLLEDVSRECNARSVSEAIKFALSKLLEFRKMYPNVEKIELLSREVDILRNELEKCRIKLREYETAVARFRSELESLVRENESMRVTLSELEKYRSRCEELTRIVDQCRDYVNRISRQYSVATARGLSYGSRRVTVSAPKIVHDMLRIVERYVSPVEMARIIEELMLFGLVEVRE